MSLFSWLGIGKSGIKDALLRGGVIVDVRSAGEFDRGKVPGSINIPVDRIPINAQRILEMDAPIVFCCTTGERCNQAIQYMKQKGLKEYYNGGNWHRVLKIAKRL
ncbi:MAG TPA: rhodanese-like domain-containing protein [Chitinophagaceae bacterium]|nr:rhodanese-like domain-containing protein [Chitinophagaceae bacterium]